MLSKNTFVMIVVSVLLTMHQVSAGEGESKNLISNDSGWASLDQGESGEFEITESGLLIKNNEDDRFIIINDERFTGSFYAEASFAKDENVALALIQRKGTEPDPDNYTMIRVDTNEEGQVVVSVNDRQNGIDNVLDYTGKHLRRIEDMEPERRDDYDHVLDGTQYSVPFTQTAKKVRIFRESNSGFFHFYYAVAKELRGERAEGWMELAPSKDWGEPGTEYSVALISDNAGTVEYNSVEAAVKPLRDQDDSRTGFRAVRREYNWTGFFGDAVVVTFDDFFPWSDNDIKYVFWAETNFIPAWHINNQLLFTYEFVETWEGGNPGCHEPMSDRILRWASVNILEDNDVRKVVHYHYVLINPDYKVPMNDQGSQLPEVDEYYTFYPDGSGTRHIVYTPKLDTDYRQRHELAELIAIAGTESHAKPYFDSPALTLTNLQGNVEMAHPGLKIDYGSHIDDWKQVIMSVHLKNQPDVFCVFSTDPDVPDTWSGYKIRYEIAWQSVNGTSNHWPVNKRPFTGNNGSGATWEEEVTHSCLMSLGVIEGIEWDDHYKVDDRGRKFREWVSLIGLNESGDVAGIRNKTSSWLFPGKVTVKNGCSFLKVDYRKKCLVFERTGEEYVCEFTLDPSAENSVLINPSFLIRNWEENDDISVLVDGKSVDESRIRADITGAKELLVWIYETIDSESLVKISSN